jgi:hypothetical protein
MEQSFKVNLASLKGNAVRCPFGWQVNPREGRSTLLFQLRWAFDLVLHIDCLPGWLAGLGFHRVG